MAKPKLTVTDLERELHFKNERIAELKNEIDELHHLVQRMEEHAQEHDEYLETFITTFGLTLNDDNKWENGEFIEKYNTLIERNSELIDDYNKLVRSFNRNIAMVQPVGRPIAASEAQQAQILK